MAILITGASGFLGRHLLSALQAANVPETVCVLVRDPALWHSMGWTASLPHVRLVQGVLGGTAEKPHAFALPARISTIFHLAALVRHSRRQTQEVFDLNIGGTLSMVRLAAEHGARMIYLSTSGTVGCSRHPSDAPLEDAPHCAQMVHGWPYYRSKVEAEVRAWSLAKTLGVDLVTVRPPMLLGPGDHRFRATSQVIRFLRGRLPFLLKGGIHYVDIRDSANALVALMRLAQPRAIYHLRGTACTVRTFFNDLAELTGLSPPRLDLPYALAWPMCKADEAVGTLLRGQSLNWLPDPVVIEMAAHHWDISSKHAEADLKVSPRPGKQTLHDTVHWLRQHHPGCERLAPPVQQHRRYG